MRRKFTIFTLFYFVFEGKFQVQAPRGAYIRRGDLTEGFLRYENYLLADYFTLISLRMLGKFLWKSLEMLKSIFSLCTDPLPSIKIGGEWGGGGLYTGYQSLASKGYSVTDVTGKIKNNITPSNLRENERGRRHDIK